MIGKIERDKIQNEHEIFYILECIEEKYLWMELMRRSAEKDSIVKDIRNSVKQERGIDGLLINE